MITDLLLPADEADDDPFIMASGWKTEMVDNGGD